MSSRLFLHRDCIVSPLFLSPRRLDGLSGSTGSLLAGSSHHDSRRYLRFVVEKNVPVRSLLHRSHTLAPGLHVDYGSHFRHPPKSGRLTHPGLFRTRH